MTIFFNSISQDLRISEEINWICYYVTNLNESEILGRWIIVISPVIIFQSSSQLHKLSVELVVSDVMFMISIMEDFKNFGRSYREHRLNGSHRKYWRVLDAMEK